MVTVNRLRRCRPNRIQDWNQNSGFQRLLPVENTIAAKRGDRCDTSEEVLFSACANYITKNRDSCGKRLYRSFEHNRPAHCLLLHPKLTALSSRIGSSSGTLCSADCVSCLSPSNSRFPGAQDDKYSISKQLQEVRCVATCYPKALLLFLRFGPSVLFV